MLRQHDADDVRPDTRDATLFDRSLRATGMRAWSACLVVVALAAVAPVAQAHGALAVNELETYAISDFEGQEDSFPWEGWEIWDVYVGDGYSQAHDSDGVYFKVNLAGDGTARPTSSQVWTVAFTFNVGDEAFARQITHDGTDVTTDFEELEWQIADGNVFQVRAWAPVADWVGQSVTDIVLVSSVDGEPRDTAPGGIHVPGAGTEVPVEAPPTAMYPAMGEGRLVEAVPLTGPGKFLDVAVVPLGNGTFDLTVTNPLAEQGQHAILRVPAVPGWTLTPSEWNANLDAGQSATLRIAMAPTTANGSMVAPAAFDILSDIGGRDTYYAFIDAQQVALTDDAALAQPATFGEPAQESPSLSLAALALALVVALGARSVGHRRP